MSNQFRPVGVFFWIGTALVAHHFAGTAGAGGVFIAAALLAGWLGPTDD